MELEELLEETKNKYEKEINHMKSQLVEQLDEHSRLKSKAKVFIHVLDGFSDDLIKFLANLV